METVPTNTTIIAETTASLVLPAGLQTNTPLWSFALQCWQKPGVAAACLQLQQHGWSVTRILCAAWLAHQGKAYNGHEAATVTEWRNRVTGALRSIRKSLPKESESGSDLRAGVADMELEAERIELALAWQSLNSGTDNSSTEGHALQGYSALILDNLSAAAPAVDSTHTAEGDIRQLALALAFRRPGAQQT